MRLIKFFSIVALALAVSSCAMFKGSENPSKMNVEDLYAKAHTSLKYADYNDAISNYQRLISRFPYGKYNEQSQIELAYAYYKTKKPEEAYAQINTFISTFPVHKNIDYAYYLRGLVNFDRTGTFLQHAFKRHNGSRLDQDFRSQSYRDFRKLVSRYPDSKYAKEARQRMQYLHNQRAEYEVNIAKFYLRQKAYVASAKRAQYVIDNFERTPEVADALAIAARSYNSLGMTDPAKRTRQVLAQNYPDHPYLEDQDWPHAPSTLRRMVPFSGHH